jgi:hypothetical protein
MPQKKPSPNPFYFVLVAVGILFTITACAYFVMTLQDASLSPGRPPNELMSFMEKHGMTALIIELVGLAIATVGAILTDDYWARRDRRMAQNSDESESIRPE